MMDCTGIDKILISLYYGELDKGDREEVLRHIGACPSCRALWEGLKSRLDKVPRRTAPAMDRAYWARYTEQVMERLDSQLQPGRGWAFQLKPVMSGAFVLLLFVGIYYFRMSAIEKDIIQNLPLLENYGMVSKIELLENLELFEKLEFFEDMERRQSG